MEKEDLPPCNAFFITDDDGDFVIPTLSINGQDLKMANLSAQRVEFFKVVAADISAHIGKDIHYVEYAPPTLIEKIEPKRSGNSMCITGDFDGLGDVLENLGKMLKDRVKEGRTKKNKGTKLSLVH